MRSTRSHRPFDFIVLSTVAWAAACSSTSSTGPNAVPTETTDSGSDGPAQPVDSGAPRQDGAAPADQALTVIRATFPTSDSGVLDLAAAKAAHDALATKAEGQARAAGDYGHDALLGTTLLGTTANEYLAVDQWSDKSHMVAFYKDPSFQAAFASHFAGTPELQQFEKQPWYGWGNLESGDSAPTHYFVRVRGHLKADAAASQALHDPVASHAEADFKGAGDVAHVVYLGIDDPREFLAIDVWADETHLEAVYTDHAFQSALGPLFDAPPSITVYASTDWKQW